MSTAYVLYHSIVSDHGARQPSHINFKIVGLRLHPSPSESSDAERARFPAWSEGHSNSMDSVAAAILRKMRTRCPALRSILDNLRKSASTENVPRVLTVSVERV